MLAKWALAIVKFPTFIQILESRPLSHLGLRRHASLTLIMADRAGGRGSRHYVMARLSRLSASTFDRLRRKITGKHPTATIIIVLGKERERARRSVAGGFDIAAV